MYDDSFIWLKKHMLFFFNVSYFYIFLDVRKSVFKALEVKSYITATELDLP